MQEQCIICGSRESIIYEKSPPPYSVRKCTSCGLVYVVPHPPDLDAHYDGDYYKEWIERQMNSRSAMWAERIAQIKRIRPQGRLLDVGCGVGTFVRLAREHGYTVAGTEVSAFACRYIQEQFGIDTFNGSLPSADYDDASFEIVSFWHTLEHMPDPLENLRVAWRVLAPGGLLVVAVPNVNNRIMRLVYPLVRRRPLRVFDPGGKEIHLYHFSQATLQRLATKAQFRVLKTGPDLAQVTWPKKALDVTAAALYALTRCNVGEGIRLFAVKDR